MATKEIETKAEMLGEIADLLNNLLFDERDLINNWEDISGEHQDELLVTLKNGKSIFIKLTIQPDDSEAK